MDRAWDMLKPGGRMVFCTCSLLPREGETQVEKFLQRQGDVKIDPLTPETYGLPTDAATSGVGMRLRPDYWPDKGGMDGFFMAVLHKN